MIRFMVSDRPWLGPLVATLLLQTTAAFLSRLVPTIAPALTAEFGWTETVIGYLAALSTLGSIGFLTAGSPLIRTTGAIRALQIGLAIGALGLALLAAPVIAAPALASFLIGFGYGTSVPAGSDILQRYAPAQHRNLIFSIKQAGVPVGGMLAGLVLPPIAESAGWRATLGVAALFAVATILAVQPLRARIDADRSRQPLRAGAFLALDNLARPLASLQSTPTLRRIAAAGACFAVGQGCWIAFLITYLVAVLHLSLIAAGFLFSIMQATGIFGRILLGWASDRLGSGILVLKAVAATSALTSLTLAVTSPSWPFWALALLAAVAGVTVSSWNGVQIAEAARRAPRALIGETAAGTTILVFLGYVIGPTAFSGLVLVAGRFDLAFVGVAVATLAALVILRDIEDPQKAA